MTDGQDCCRPDSDRKHGWIRGALFGLLPHSFCLAFIAFSVLGATGAAVFARQFLLLPHFFLWLMLASGLAATVSAAVYLKKTQNLCWRGLKRKKGYLVSMYAATAATNVLFMFVLFPAAANMQTAKASSVAANLETITLTVDIPCSGHAPLIIDEIKTDPGVSSVAFSLPSTFTVSYDAAVTSPERIRSLDVFQTFQLTN